MVLFLELYFMELNSLQRVNMAMPVVRFGQSLVQLRQVS
jgi:hypothetical protein